MATLLSLSGAAYLAPLTASAAVPSDYGLAEGNTISAAGTNDPDIYIVNAFGYKRLFLNPVIFNFYGHLGGFAKVKSVSSAARDAFPTTALFRNCETNDQKVWAVEVNGEDTAVLHWVNVSGDAAVSQDANFFKKVFCVNNNEAAWYTKSAVAYTSLSQIPVYARVPGQTPIPVGALSVGISSDNPASGTIVAAQASADLAHFTFTGSGAVTSVKLKRTGVSGDSTLTNVYLYDGARRLTDAATVSDGVISFNDSNGLFTVSGSKTISVKSDILTGTAGQTVGVQLTSFTSGSSVTTTTLSGNVQTIATATLASVALSASNTVSTNTALDPSSDVNVWQNTATVGTRAVNLQSLQFRVIGSVNVGDIQNFRLYVDGVQKGSAVAQTDSNGYVVFDLTGAPARLETGGRIIKVLANVVGGSSRNFTVSLRQAPDISAVDTQYSQPVLATAGGSFPSAAGQQTISSGTITFTKTNDSPSGDVVKGASNQTLGKWEVKASGEKMKVESLRANFIDSLSYTSAASTVGQLRNAAFFLNGVQIGSTQSLNEDSFTTTYTEYTFGSAFIVTPGAPASLELRADVYDADGTDNTLASQTIQAQIIANTSNVQRLTTLSYIDCLNGTGCSATAAGVANSVTVKTGSFTAGKYSGFANQTVVYPKTNTKLGHFTLAAASSEDINVNTVTIDSAAGTGATFTADDISDMYIKVWNDTGSLIYQSPTKSTVSATASNSYSVNFMVPKNKTYQVEVFGNVGSTITATHSIILNMDASGISGASSTTATAAAAVGQTITANTGALNTNNGSLATSQLVAGGTTKTAYSFTLQPQYDDYTLTEVYVDLNSTLASATGAVANLYLKDASTGATLGSATINTSTASASFTGLNIPLTQLNGTKTFNVDVQFANVGVGANDTGGKVVVQLDGLKYLSSSGSVTTSNGLSTSTYTGNTFVDHKAYPTFVNQSLSSTVLSAGTRTLASSKVTSNGGSDIALKYLTWTVAKTANPTITESSLKLFKNGVDVTSLGSFASASAGTDLDTTSAGTGYLRFTFTNQEVVNSTGATYELQATVAGNLIAGQSISTKIGAPSSSVVTQPASTVAGTLSATSSSVVWSDQSDASHSATTGDWMNDYLIPGINISQTMAL
jgi:hypothetical protein